MGTPEPFRQLASERSVVAFDFDGTLTTKDSFTAFLHWTAGPLAYFTGVLRLAPNLVAYLFHRNRGRLKAAATARFLGGMSAEALAECADRFAVQHAQSMLRPDAMQAWRNWRAQGAVMVIVTASPEITIRPFARALGADVLIGTRLALDEAGRVTGRFGSPNCRGPEKIRRLREAFGDDIALAAAYGDTSGDREMLRLAEIKGYRIFKGKP